MTGSGGDRSARPLVRVLYHIQGNVFGGAHNQVLQLAGPLARHGYESVALLPDEPGDAAKRLVDAGVEVHQLDLTRVRAGLSPVRLARQAGALRRQGSLVADFLVRNRIDMVQLHGLLALDGAAGARQAGVPIVWQLIDTRPPVAMRRALTPLVNRWADAVMTTGTRLLREYPALDADPGRFVPFYPPVREDAFADAASEAARTKARRSLLGAEADDAVVVGSLGNLNPQKGFEYLIEAVAALRRAGRPVRLVIRGADSPGHPGYRRLLDDLLRRHELPADTIQPLPAGMRAAEYMPALDVFALTPVRRSEGVPTVLLEALWAGLPCVATDVGGVGEVVHDDVGALCRPESTDSIAGALARVLDAGEAGRRRMAEHARTMAEERFTLEQCTAAHVQAYDLARRRHASRGASPARPESSPGREVGT